MANWVRSQKWAPATPGGGSAGFSVECPDTGELAHAKPVKIGPEVLGYLLAREAGVAVPVVEIGTHNGATIAVSKMWGPQSMDVPMVSRVSPDAYASAGFEQALRGASGLLVYHAWVGSTDLKDEHLLVRPGAAPGEYEVAAIDFADAFGWAVGAGIAIPGAPAALIAHRDVNALTATLERIEAIPSQRIREIVTGLPDDVLPIADKERISTGLVARQGALRVALHAAGWL